MIASQPSIRGNTLVVSILLSLVSVAAEAQPAADCQVQVGFFNGVFNTQADALWAMYALDEVPSLPIPPSHYTLFYNATGRDRDGATGYEDLAEVFAQRTREQAGVLFERWETFWEMVHSERGAGTIIERLSETTPALGDLAEELGKAVWTESVSQLTTLLSSPPTEADLRDHREKLDRLIKLDQRLVLVAHSQGNLFMNDAYDYAQRAVGVHGLAAVHIAPASVTLHGPHTLANLDLVINALRVTGPVPDITVDIPPLLSRPAPVDPSGHELLNTYLHHELDTYTEIKQHLDMALMDPRCLSPLGMDDGAIPTRLIDAGVDAAPQDASADARASVSGTDSSMQSSGEASDASTGRELRCGANGRYRATVTGAWDDEVLDTQTGKIWHRTNERVAGLETCSAPFGWSASEDPICCKLGGQDPTFGKCNWTGAAKSCANAGMRLATNEELTELAEATGTCDQLSTCPVCFPSWETWSATSASDATAYYVRSRELGLTATSGITTFAKANPNGTFGVKCVRDP